MSKHIDLPMQTRSAAVGTVNAEARTAELVWSTGAAVKRYDYWNGRSYMEELSMEPQSIDMGRLNSGAPLLNSHDGYDLAGVIGVVEKAWLDGTEGRALVRFSQREDVSAIFEDVKSGIIRNVSVGYNVRKYEVTERDGQLPVYRAVDWEPMEISLVPIGADAGAGVRSDSNRKKTSCEFIEPAEPANNERNQPMSGATQVPAGQQTADEAEAEQRKAADAIAKKAAETERQRGIDIRSAVRAARLPESFADDLIAKDITADGARKAVLERLAEQGEVNPTRGAAYIDVVQDETVVRREMVANAILHRVNPGKTKLEEGARPFRHMSLLRLAEETLAWRGINARGLSRLEIATRAFNTVSDFPAIAADVMNKRLRAAYEENQPSYRRWAYRAPDAPDFKNINVVQLGGAPDLLQVNEDGEFKYGTIADGKETYKLITYGRIIALSRQAIINDDTRAFDRIPVAFGGAAARLENRLVYAQLTSNPALGDGVALFHTTHANLTSSGTAISVASLTVGRAAMRLQKGLAQEELNLAPSYLIVPASQEQLAYQYTSSNYTPAKSSDVNEFRSGGRTALEPIVEAVLDASSTTAWYLACDANAAETVEYCWLDGADGVYLESDIGFDVDGLRMKARLDFAAKAADFRGLYKNVGA